MTNILDKLFSKSINEKTPDCVDNSIINYAIRAGFHQDALPIFKMNSIRNLFT